MRDKVDKSVDGKDSTSKKSRDCDQDRAKSSSGKHHRVSKTSTVDQNGFLSATKAAAAAGTAVALPLNLLSPQSSKNFASRPESGDTPPPTNLNAASPTMTTSGLEGRTTRRPRGSVSYAEPNLRDKMRRPTKDLVDAVGTDDRPQLIKIEEANPAGTNSNRSRIRTVTVKQEDPGMETSSVWKNLPLLSEDGRRSAIPRYESANPVDGRTSSSQTLPTGVEANGRVSGYHEEIVPPSASGSTIAALAAGSQKAHKRECNEQDEKVGEPKDLFEIHTSSSAEDVPKPKATVSTRASRRHSSTVNKLDPKILRTTAAESILRRGDRRRESTVSQTERVGKQRDVESDLSGEGGASERQTSVPTGSLGISERSASRRRSMML